MREKLVRPDEVRRWPGDFPVAHRYTPGVAGEAMQEYPQREVDPKSIYAIQFIHYPPDDLPISAHKLYRVLKVEEDDGYAATVKEFDRQLTLNESILRTKVMRPDAH